MSRDTNFYYSFLVLPSEKRRAIIAVWDFCRAVDDAVDRPDGGPAAATPEGGVGLAYWRRELAALYAAGQPASEQGCRLAPWIRRFGLPRKPFEDLIDGVEMDLAGRRYPTFADLYEYCYRVASTVGLICVRIFECRDPRSQEYAVSLGIALQLTNILRDIPYDLSQGRLYVPLEDLNRFGCDEDTLRAGHVTPPVARLLRHQAERARRYYEKTRAVLPAADARRLAPAEIMAAIYLAILTRIERAGYDVFSTTPRVSRPRRALIAAAVWARAMMGWRARPFRRTSGG